MSAIPTNRRPANQQFGFDGDALDIIDHGLGGFEPAVKKLLFTFVCPATVGNARPCKVDDDVKVFE